MSTRNRVRIKKKDYIASFADFLTLVETTGVAFTDGYCIELIEDANGSLSLLDSNSAEPQKRINHAGQVFIPPEIESSVLRAITFPRGRADYGETGGLFARIFCLFVDWGLIEDYALVCSHFVVASWFPEALQTAPCLVLTGAEAEARTILRLLSALVRLSLPLAEISIEAFDCVTANLQPTLLVAHVNPAMWELLAASNRPHAHLARKKKLIDLFCAKAVYWGPTLLGVGDEAVLNVHCVPTSASPPALNYAILEQIAAEFQPMLLDYRIRNIQKVLRSKWDASTAPARFRTIAQALAACIIDDSELQAGIVPLLENQSAALRPIRLLDLSCVILEALLARCHGEIGPVRVGVHELASIANTLLEDHAETAVLESKRVGRYLRELGFRPERDSKGYSVHLTADVRRLIHILARDRQFLNSERVSPACPDCLGEQLAEP